MFVVVKKRGLLIAVLLIAILLSGSIAAIVLGTRSENASARTKKLLPVYSVKTEENKVALTFDAAWGSDKTEKILDLLDMYDVHATFFLVGFWIEANPELTQEIASRGHCIGNHSEDHPHLPTLGKEEMGKQIDSVNDRLEALTGQRAVFFRPPFGDYDDTLISTLQARKMVGVQWNVDSLDWKGISGGQIAERILSRVDKGSIILCHNNSDHILEALPMVLLGLKNKGLQAVRIDELVLTEGYSIEHDGTQIKLT